MATFSRVTPTGWSQGDNSSSYSRASPAGWEQETVSVSSITLTSGTDTQSHASSTVVIYKFPVQPGTDVTTTGWTSTAGSLSAAINEFPSDDASYINSPWIDGGQGPAITTLDQPLPAGTWGITVRAKATLATSQVRIHLLDSSNTILGTSSWQTLTTSYADYALNITTSVVATRIQYEVQ